MLVLGTMPGMKFRERADQEEQFLTSQKKSLMILESNMAKIIL